MALMDFIKKQFIDVIHWTEEGDGVLAYRYPMQDFEIQNGAQLTVRDSQICVFVNEGQVADVFGPGLYTLNTQTLPILTNLKNWDKLFDSPFKSDVYFFSTRLQLDRKWGTPNPITIRDKDFGMVRMRAFGIYSYKLKDPGLFYKEISGTRDTYFVDDLDDEGQVLRKTLDLRAVYARVSAVAHDAARDGGPGEIEFARFAHEFLIEGLSVNLVRFADDDAKRHRSSFEFHEVLLSEEREKRPA